MPFGRIIGADPTEYVPVIATDPIRRAGGSDPRTPTMATTSTGFTLHTAETAPGASADILRNVEAAWRFVPNLHAVLAEAPAALEAYSAIFSMFERTSFTPAERQVIYLAINRVNECEYCMAGHSVLAKAAGVDAETIEGLREGHSLNDGRLQALRSFVQSVVRERGHLPRGEVQAFLDAGFTRQQVLEVVLGVAIKTISNYANHLSDTPNDAFMANTAWTAPSRRGAAAA